MKAVKTYILLSVVFAILIPASTAFSEGDPVTPYGDFCPRCGQYGSCKSQMSIEDAEKAIAEYYHKKGFRIKIEQAQGRFIKADIKKGREVVDVIIFDRRTGRIRSIY
jgi:hypothetical protein